MLKLQVRRRRDRAASLTAHFNAAQRAAESMLPSPGRLLEDPYAQDFAGPYKGALITPSIAPAAVTVIDY